MPQLIITNFKAGLDTRRSELSSSPGTLQVLTNGHINEGGECEKRKSFTLNTTLPSGVGYTYGFLPTESSIYVFGSATSETVGSLPSPYTYQQLVHPDATHTMTGVVSNTLFSGNPFVAAKFSDGNVFCYYKGVLVEDFIAGLVTPWSNTDAEIATALGALVNATGSSPVAGEKTYTANVNGDDTQIFSTPTISSTTPYTIAVTTTLESGSTGKMVAAVTNAGLVEIPATQAVGSFQIVSGIQATPATGTLTGSSSHDINVGDTITVGSVVYTFVSTITNSTANQIFQGGGGSADVSLENFIAAINGTGVPGSQYSSATVKSSTVTASTLATHATTITAIVGGLPGELIALSYTANGTAYITVSNTSGGKLANAANNNEITQINVGTTNILAGGAVPFNQNNVQTAEDIANNINNNQSVFTASANNNAVTITGPSAGAINYNGLPISVVVAGAVAIQQMGVVVVSATTDSGAVSSITIAGGSNLLTATITFQDGAHGSETYSQFVGRIAANLNANGSFSGTYTAMGVGQTLYISPLTSTSTSTPGVLAVTTTGTITINAASTADLTIVITYTVSGNSVNLTANITGGNSPYSYNWYTPTGVGLQTADNNNIGFQLSNATSQTAFVNLVGASGDGTVNLDVIVTDSALHTATIEAMTVTGLNHKYQITIFGNES